MKLPIQVEIKAMPMATLLDTFSPEEVLGYCSHCNNYGHNHSCPDFGFDVNGFLKPYRYAILILTHVPTEAVKASWDTLKTQTYVSRVSKLHLKDQSLAGTNSAAALSMMVFNQIKDRISELLLDAEKHIGGISSPPGSCTRCEVCGKELGNPCIMPDKLRYSLESLGFKVNQIYGDFFGIDLEWTDGVLPEAFHSCSALFLKDLPDGRDLDGASKDLSALLEGNLQEIDLS